MTSGRSRVRGFRFALGLRRMLCVVGGLSFFGALLPPVGCALPRRSDVRSTQSVVEVADAANADAYEPDVTATFSLATWNILFLNLDLDVTAEHILQSDTDVVLLQEVTPEGASALEPALLERYPHQSWQGEFGMLSKAPMAWVVLIPAEHRRRAVQIAAIDFSALESVSRGPGGMGRVVLVANVHLEAQVLEDPTPAGIARSLDHAESTHSDELRMLVRRLDPQFPRVIAGDFNAMPFHRSLRVLRSRDYRDAASATHLWPDSTWSDAIFGVPFWLRIDYVFAAGPLVALDTGISEASTSDHHLLRANLAFAKGKGPATVAAR